MNTIIIAEVGENHLGDMDAAKRMIRESAAAGADIVKFQSYRAVDVADDDPEKEWFAKVELSDAAHFELARVASEAGVEFMSAPFTLERARFLCEAVGLRKIKIASSEMLNGPLLNYVNSHASTVFLSTGLSTLAEVNDAVERLRDVEHLFVLHCVTQYPTLPEDANLLAIRTLQQSFPRLHIGYSDHTIGIRAAVASVAVGAAAVEKHFTLDKSLPGTDHVLSADPAELRAMVEEIRAVEVLLGSGGKGPTAAEETLREFVRGRFPKDVAHSRD